MKKLLFQLALAALPFLCIAQNKAVSEFYQKYSQEDNLLDIKLSGGLLNLVANKMAEDGDKKVIRKISAIRVLVMEEGNKVKKEDYNSLLRSAKNDAYEALIKVRDGQDHIEILVREKNNTITNVLLLVNGQDNFIMLSLEGSLQFSDLNDIDLNVDGGSFFKKIPEKRKRGV